MWFTVRFFRPFKLHEVFPTYFICYVGIVVASVTSPAFGMQALGQAIFWFGFACYAALLVLVTYRYAKHEVPEGARPLFCIYTAPHEPVHRGLPGRDGRAERPVRGRDDGAGPGAVPGGALPRLPRLLRLKFYPSYAAMTFPFVITATALGQGTAFFRANGVALPFAFDVVFYVEVALATIMVAYVLAHYLRFFFSRIEQPQSVAVLKENAQIARFSENFDN